MWSYESVPGSVSYEKLLRVVQQRTTVDKAYDERLYLLELTNALWERVRHIRQVTDTSKNSIDQDE
jgi:hypothetical protein